MGVVFKKNKIESSKKNIRSFLVRSQNLCKDIQEIAKLARNKSINLHTLKAKVG